MIAMYVDNNEAFKERYEFLILITFRFESLMNQMNITIDKVNTLNMREN